MLYVTWIHLLRHTTIILDQCIWMIAKFFFNNQVQVGFHWITLVLFNRVHVYLYPDTKRICDLKMYIYLPKTAKSSLFCRAEYLNCRIERVGAVFSMPVYLCHSALLNGHRQFHSWQLCLNARGNGCLEVYGLHEALGYAVGDEVGMRSWLGF